MSRTSVEGPLFVSRGVLATACFVLWILGFYLACQAGGKTAAASWHFLASGLELLGLLVAVQASDSASPRGGLVNLRATWLVLATASGGCAALAAVQERGIALLGANALFSAVAVLLVAHLWNLRGFVTLALATAAVNTTLYVLTPAADLRTTSNVLFLSLLPGAVGTVSVLLRRDALQRKGASGLSERLDSLTRAINAKTSARESELAVSKSRIDELFGKVAKAPSLPLDPAMAEEARELAGHLRRLLLEEWSDNWLAEALELEGLAGSVTVAQPFDVVEGLPEASRPALLAATMLMAVGSTLRGPDRGATAERAGPPHRIHFFAEKSGQDGARLTWRIQGVHKNHLPPLLWTELDSLGHAKAGNDREGCSIVVETGGRRR
ncbi:hypothetical protein [Arthrobacter bambusae]|uniref:hypothetical protein n=1 Tax=Arthrobacter bambusae TaxID=1338426 RepID=UPI002786EF75|nr:hypothetical protein [Arthrobacter bambusae]MDQ0029546.1 hypothetical protein [Arthrobacter bambusae]MDQ0097206.1 hypothetical protein [Arthrobacter bambusae]